MNLIPLRETALSACQLVTGAPILVGVSGGPDSLCLLDTLHRSGFSVIAAHYDHQLRSGSDRDAEFVRQFAEGLAIPFILGREDVAQFAAVGRIALEEAARTLRYRFLFAQAREQHAQAVAVGHTANDQVETVLMHLLRGAGLGGMMGMRYRTVIPAWDAHIPLVRPLLDTWRDEIEVYCSERGFTPLNDPSNQETIFFRNRVRHQVIPFLETLNPRVRENIWRTAQLLAGDAAVVQPAIQAAWESCAVEQSAGAVTLELTALQALPVGLRRAVLRQAVAQRLPDLRDVDFAAVERVARLVQAPGGGQIDLVRGLRAFVEGDRLWIASDSSLSVFSDGPQIDVDEISLPVPAEIDLPRGWRVQCAWVSRDAIPAFTSALALRWDAWLDAEGLPEKLCLRRTRPGDRFQPLGMDGHSQKLSDFWINAKLPRRARANWPLLVGGDETILWVPGFRPAHPYRVTDTTRRALYLRFLFPRD